jgi:hypothetical protein
MYPGKSGIIGNLEFRPEIFPHDMIHTEALDTVRRGDLVTRDRYLQAPTLAELLRGRGLATAILGAKPVVLLHDRKPRSSVEGGVNFFAGKTLPQSLESELVNVLGAFPKAELSTTNRDYWITDALVGPLWNKEVPAFSLLWLSEPDRSQHATGAGSPASLAAIRNSDRMLERVIDALGRKGVLGKTDLFVVSDHGFSTIQQALDLAEVLKQNGFRAFRKFPATGPENGDIMVVPDGGSAFLYVTGHERQTVEKLVRFLQSQDFTGVVFSRQAIQGTFDLESVRLGCPHAPDIVLSFRWSERTNSNGIPGLIFSDDGGERGPGQGMHGTLSRYDMHNVCVAAGPDFKAGVADSLPTGNTDIAPTILEIFGIKPRHTFSGRVLREAFAHEGPITTRFETRRIEATCNAKDFVWTQYLAYSEVNGVSYFDEGNGEQIRKSKKQ